MDYAKYNVAISFEQEKRLSPCIFVLQPFLSLQSSLEVILDVCHIKKNHQTNYTKKICFREAIGVKQLYKIVRNKMRKNLHTLIYI